MLVIFIYLLLCVAHKANSRPGTIQHFLDYLYDWSYGEKFSHPQYEADVDITMISPRPTVSTTEDDTQAKLVRHQLTKYAINLFKVMANRSFEASKLDLEKDLNYTGSNVNEFIVKWYLKEINLTRGDIFFTKTNNSKEVRGKDLNNLIVALLNRKLTGTTAKKADEVAPPLDETLRNLEREKYENEQRMKEIKERINRERIMKLKKENIRKETQKIDITKLNTINFEYLMLQKIKENYKNKKYDDPYINVSDLEKRLSNTNEDRPTPYPGRQFPNPGHPGIDPSYPRPEYPPDYPPLPVHPASIYPPRDPAVLGAFPSPEEMGIELRPGEPGYTGTPGIPGPSPGLKWSPPTPHFGPTGVTRRPLPGDSPRPTRSLPPSVHGDPDRPFGSLLFQNPRPMTTTRDPLFEGLLQDMQTQKNGYLTMFLIKLFEYIAIMRKEYARLLIVRLEPVLSRLHGQQQLTTFGEPFTTKLLNIARLMNSAPADVVQSHAATAHYALTHRWNYLSSEINGILDYADSLYNDIEGQKLLKTLNDVKLYPNITKTNIQLADEILDEALLAPYRRMTGTHRIQVLFDSINTAIIRRFPGMRRILKKAGAMSTRIAVQSTLLNIQRIPRKHEKKAKKQKLSKGKTKRNNHREKNKTNIYVKKRGLYENMDDYETLLNNNKKKRFKNNTYREMKAKSKRILKGKQLNCTEINAKCLRNKTNNKHKTDKSKGNTDKSKIINFKSNTFCSDCSVEEKEFKDKLNDVLRHGNMVENIVLRIGKQTTARPKNNYLSSYSDEEGVLKQNIYKVFSNKLRD